MHKSQTMSQDIYRLPAVPARIVVASSVGDWKISKGEDGFVLSRGAAAERRSANAWSLKEQFLSVSSVDDAKAFLETFGDFGAISIPAREAAPVCGCRALAVFGFIHHVSAPAAYSKQVKFSDLVLAQAVVKAFAVAQFSEWPGLLENYESSSKQNHKWAEALMARSICVCTKLNI